MSNEELRDQFAVSAMESLISEGFYSRDVPPDSHGARSHERLARTAYDLADAMILARETASFSNRSDPRLLN